MPRSKEYPFGRYLEDFQVGDIYSHSSDKTITESDNNFFCLMTMNHHPIHLNKEFAKKSQYNQILVVGTYVFSLVVGMTVSDISGMAIANLEYEKITHDAPVFIGDTIHSESTVLDIKPSKNKPDRGVLYIETRAYNQHSKKVLTFRRRILIPRKML